MAGAIGMLLGWLTAQKGAPDFLMAVGGGGRHSPFWQQPILNELSWLIKLCSRGVAELSVAEGKGFAVPPYFAP